MSRASVIKGKNWERAVAKAFREAMPGCGAKRGFQYRGGGEVADVVVPLLHVEAKVGRQPNPRAALKQAIGDAPASKMPVAVIKDDHKPPFVVMLFTDFLDLVGENWEMGKK